MLMDEAALCALAVVTAGNKVVGFTPLCPVLARRALDDRRVIDGREHVAELYAAIATVLPAFAHGLYHVPQRVGVYESHVGTSCPQHGHRVFSK